MARRAIFCSPNLCENIIFFYLCGLQEVQLRKVSQPTPILVPCQNLFGQLFHISSLILNLDDKPLCELVLFGNKQLNVASNRKILQATICFIKNTKRFSNTN